MSEFDFSQFEQFAKQWENATKEMAGENTAPISSISEAGSSVSFSTSILQDKLDDKVRNMQQLNSFRLPYRIEKRKII